MTQPFFKLENGIYTKQNREKPFWILTTAAILFIIGGIATFIYSDLKYLGLITLCGFGILILAGASNKVVIDTNSKKINQSFLFGLFSFNKNGNLYNQYLLEDNYMNGVNIGVQIYLISKEKLSKKIFMFGPFKNQQTINEHVDIVVEILHKLRSIEQ